MRYGFIKLFISLVIGCANTASAQQHIFKNYTVNDGLVSNTIRRIFQDSKGFLWIATWEGLSKYDGHKFNNYTMANGLSHYMVNDIYETKSGTLYAALNYEFIDTIRDGKIAPIKLPATMVINRYFITPGQKVIVATDFNGLQELSNGKLIKPHQPFPASNYYDIIPYNDSLFIAVTSNAVHVFNYQYELFAAIKEAGDIYTEGKLLKDSKGRIFVTTYRGLKTLNIPSQKNDPITYAALPAPFELQFLQQNKVNDIFEDADGTIWLGTTAGLVRINPSGSYQVITMKNGLVSEKITTIFQDREKNIWFGTSFGLSKLVTRSNVIVYTKDDGLWTSSLNFICPYKKNNFLISGTTGVQEFNTQTGKFIPIANSHNQGYYGFIPNSNPLILYSNAKAAYIDTLSSKIGNTIFHPHDGIWKALMDKQGNFFYLSGENLFYAAKKTDTVLSFRMADLLIDKKYFLWAGAWWKKGLYRIHYIYDDNGLQILSKDQYLPDESIRSLFEDSKGNIWVGTRFHGVYRLSFDKSGKMISKNFNQQKGLTSNFIKGIAEDGNGNIWLAFFQGLDKLVLQDTTYRIINFSRVSNYYASVSNMIVDDDNSLWLATAEGLAHIKDGKMEKLPPTPVYITKVSSPDSLYAESSNSISLNYRKNRLQFEFSSPGYINEKQVLYSYRLLGSKNDEWTVPSNEHSVSYASLQPGSYVFEVRSLGWNNMWSEPAKFKFDINPPMWQTWWFRTGALLFIVALSVWLMRRRIKNIRQEATLKHKMAEAEMAALRSQMNPHFIFNCLNAIDNLIQTNQKDKATAYLSRFAKLIRNVLDSSKNNIVPFQKDFESLGLYLEMEQFRCNNRFEYELTADDELSAGDYKVPPLIIQPFVENAIHHGLLNKETGNRKLIVTARLYKERIQYTIEDNGIGREKAGQLMLINKPEHKSYGIQITEERIRLYNKVSKSDSDVTITDLYENNEPTGTRIEIKLIIAEND